MSKFLSGFTNLLNISHPTDEDAKRQEITSNEKVFLTEDIYIRKGLITKVDRDYVTIDGVHTVHRSRIGKNLKEFKAGDVVAYKAEEFDSICDHILEIMEVISPERTLKDEDFMPIQQVCTEISKENAETSKSIEHSTAVSDPRPHSSRTSSPPSESSRDTDSNSPQALDLAADDVDTESNADIRIIDGYISLRQATSIVINQNQKDEHQLDLNELVERPTFDPAEGDLIVIAAEPQRYSEHGAEFKYISVKPSAIKDLDVGTVTTTLEDLGLIDNEIVFFKHTADNFEPKPGDRVQYRAIESQQLYKNDTYEWRAVSLKLEEAGEVNVRTSEEKAIDISPASVEVQFLEENEKQIKSFIIENLSERTHTLKNIAIFGRRNDSQCTIINDLKYRKVEPGEKLILQFEVKSRFYGIHFEVFKFNFRRFSIKATVKIELHDLDGIHPSIGTGPIYKNRFYTRQVYAKAEAIPGERMLTAPRFIDKRLQFFEVDDNLKDTVLQPMTQHEIHRVLKKKYPLLIEKLTAENYQERFHLLLHLEEIQHFHNMRTYDRERAHFFPEDEYLALHVENIAERRPSLVIGDHLEAINPRNPKEVFEGFIHKVMNDRVLLKFNYEFHSTYNGQDFKLVFRFSRTNFRKQHETVNRVADKMGPTFLFPTELHLKPPRDRIDLINGKLFLEGSTREFPWYNESLNMVQKQAVYNILRGVARPLPYVIFGPPGTGKTMTLVEIILQIKTIFPEAKVLAGAPSNSCVNLITERLIDSGIYKPEEFARIVSYNVIEREMVPPHLKKYCCTVELAKEHTAVDEEKTHNGIRIQVPVAELAKKKIVIGTCATLGSLMPLGMKSDTFTHVLIDEAGQLIEPEALIPSTLLDKRNGQIILAGDPQQLGPITFSPYASKSGLSTSYLCRIMRLPLYHKNVITQMFNPVLVTQLIYNYRSIPSLLKAYSDIFYESTLVPMIKPETSDEAKLLRDMQPALVANSSYYVGNRPAMGIHFVSVKGKNVQEVYSPSWMNPIEAKVLIRCLVNMLKLGIESADVGIIAPYQLQCKCLRDQLKEAQIKELPKIGTVEEFQGQERKIILITTVRTSEGKLDYDKKFYLGFMKESRRLNVAISRARALVVIFGYKELLVKDSNWKQLIMYCAKNGTYHGCTDGMLDKEEEKEGDKEEGEA